MSAVEIREAKSSQYQVNTSLQEKALIGGNLADLSPAERLNYYGAICESLGLNALTRPFEYITLNGKLTLYARKDCTEQLRNLREISIKIVSRELLDGVFIVTAQASNAKGRSDESIGAVPLSNAQGEAKANAIMKAETKAKRRVTLSFCGLGILDESEIESIPTARVGVSPQKPTPLDKGSAVLDKMKKNGNGSKPDAAASWEESPPASPRGTSSEASLPSSATMTAANVCQQLALCETKEEFAGVMNMWMAEKSVHSEEDGRSVEKAKEATKKRLGLRS